MKLRYIFPLLFSVSTFLPAQTYNYYYGNLHSHTAFSDGNKDSATTGVSTPAGAYAYAKLSQNFNFLGVSEHNHYSSYKNPGFQLPLYQSGLNMANAANQNDTTFLSLFGMEYGVTSTYNGHVVVYGFNQLLGWENGNYDIYNGKTDYDGLFRKVKNNPNSFCYLAHPFNTDYTTTGTAATALYNSPYNAVYDSAIVGVPLRSGDAFSTFTNYSDYPSSNYFNYYTKLLSIGYHIGIGYDHDNHYTTFGRNNAGRLVIMAPKLTTANLVKAMQQMHFYGSDDWNAKITFEMNGSIMGSVLSGTTMPSFNVVHNDPDGEQASYIKIWRGISGGNNPPQIIYYVTQNNTATFIETSMNPGQEYYYFAEITQADGQWIVTSPIWYTNKSLSTVSVPEREGIRLTAFPNPVSGDLSLTLSTAADYVITINDLAGRTVLQETFHDTQYRKDLSQLGKGVYILNIKSSGASFNQRLIIE